MQGNSNRACLQQDTGMHTVLSSQFLAGVLALQWLVKSQQSNFSFKFLRANFKQLAYAFSLSFSRDLFIFYFLNSDLVSEFLFLFSIIMGQKLRETAAHEKSEACYSKSWRPMSNVVCKCTQADFIMWFFSSPSLSLEPFHSLLTFQLYCSLVSLVPAWQQQWLRQ